MKSSTSKTNFLITESVEVLHAESREWLNDIAFWKDEIEFFEKLIQEKQPSKENQEMHQKIYKDLKEIETKIFSDMEEKIRKQEKDLARVMKGEKGVPVWDFRADHREVKTEINAILANFKNLKAMIFGYVKSI